MKAFYDPKTNTVELYLDESRVSSFNDHAELVIRGMPNDGVERRAYVQCSNSAMFTSLTTNPKMIDPSRPQDLTSVCLEMTNWYATRLINKKATYSRTCSPGSVDLIVGLEPNMALVA
jgi:hypothetical protein